MANNSYKQLHEIKCGSLLVQNRVNVVDSCIHGYIASAVNNAVLLFNVDRYLKANDACSLRKDKPLPDHEADLSLSVNDPVSWIAFNSSGLVLAVATSSASHGTFVHLVSLEEVLKIGSCSLSAVSRPVRVCGGEQLTPDGQPGWELRDFAWNPTTPTLFVVVLRSGAVRLLSATPKHNEPEELINQLPNTADARCLSWSTKGKQLAICITGTISTQTGPLQGPLILQADPQLRVKRIVSLHTIWGQIKTTDFQAHPLDVLWTSPACFILGLCVSSQSSGATMRLILVNAPTKSNEVSWVEIEDLFLQPESSHNQFYLVPMGSNHFVATQSAGGEQLILFQLPPTGSAAAALSKPTVVTSIELPPAGSVLGLSLGFLRSSPSPGIQSPWFTYLVTRLTSGNLSTFALKSFEFLSPVLSALPETVQLPVPRLTQATETMIPTIEQQKQQHLQQQQQRQKQQQEQQQQQQKQQILQQKRQQSNQKQQSPQSEFSPQASLEKSECVLSNRSSETTFQPSLPRSDIPRPSAPFHPPSTSVFSGIERPISIPQHASGPPPTPIASASLSMQNTGSSDVTLLLEKSTTIATTVSPVGDIPLPKSIQIAATQFTTALHAEAESGRSAWRDLFNMLKNGPRLGSSEVPTAATTASVATESTGVDVTEAKLHDTELFLTAMDEVLRELKSSSEERKADVTNSVNYAERVRKAVHIYADGASIPVLEGHMDPEAARLLSRLKHRARLAESGLFDLDNQLEALTAEVKKLRYPLLKSPTSRGLGAQNAKVSQKRLGPASKLLSVLDTTTRLLQTERGRVDYLIDGFQRLHLIHNGTPMREVRQLRLSSPSDKAAAPRYAYRDKLAKSGDTHHLTTSPVWQSLIQRDRAIYRLFSNHKLSTVHAQFVLPLISNAESTASLVSATDSFEEAVETTSVSVHPAPSEMALNSPQQVKLEKLLNESAKAANTSSPPSTKCSSLSKSALFDSSRDRSPLTVASSPFVVKAPPLSVQSTASGSLPSSMESGNLTTTSFAFTADLCHSSQMHFTAPSMNITAVDPRAVPPATRTTSPGSFRLGVKSASTFSPVSPNLVVQKSTGEANTIGPALTSSSSTNLMQSKPHDLSPDTRPTDPRTPSSLSARQDGTHPGALPPPTPIPCSNGSQPLPMGAPTPTPSIDAARTTASVPTSSPFSLFSNVGGAKLFGQTNTQLFGANTTTALGTKTTTASMVTTSKPNEAVATVSSAATSVQSLFASVAPVQTATVTATTVSAATTTPVSEITGALFRQGLPSSGQTTTLQQASTSTTTVSLTATGTDTTATVAPSLPSFSLLGSQTTKPGFGTAAFGTGTTSNVSLFGAPTIGTVTSGGLFGSLKSSTATTTTGISSTSPLFGSQGVATAVTAAGGLFGSLPTSTTSAFHQPTLVTTAGGGLFSSIPSLTTANTTSGSVGTGGLFSTNFGQSVATTAATTTGTIGGGLFGTNQNSVAAGLFGSVGATSTTTATGIFGRPVQAPSPKANLFATNTQSGSVLHSSQSITANSSSLSPAPDQPATTGGLFSSLNSASQPTTAPGGGLFGAASTTSPKEINSLFSGSSFGLGSPTSASQTPVQNVFGRPSGPSAGFGSPGLFGASTTNPTGAGLFGAPAFSTTTASSSPPGTGLFGSNALAGGTGGLFGSNTVGKSTGITQPASSGGLFGTSPPVSTNTSNTAPSGGLFGSLTGEGGFGSKPVFGSSAFGQPAFGVGGASAFGASVGGLFGSAPLSPTSFSANPGGSLFGGSLGSTGATTAGGGGLFAGLAAKTDGPSFGSLAMGSPQAQPTKPVSPFGASPSFTQRRA